MRVLKGGKNDRLLYFSVDVSVTNWYNERNDIFFFSLTLLVMMEVVIMSSRQLVIFNINGEDFGIEVTQVKEIIRPVEIFKIPNTPEFVEGLINLRGKVHPVFNLRKRFNLPAQQFDDNTKIIIVNANDAVMGFIVDEVKEIIRVEEENIESSLQVLTDVKGRFVNGVAKTSDRIILLLDLSTTLSMKNEDVPVKA